LNRRVGGPQEPVWTLWRRGEPCTAVDLYEIDILLWCKDEEVQMRRRTEAAGEEEEEQKKKKGGEGRESGRQAGNQHELFSHSEGIDKAAAACKTKYFYDKYNVCIQQFVAKQ
jgi:hypothetical protein